MAKQITLEEALKLVSFYHTDDWGWGIHTVDGDIHGDIGGDIGGIVYGNVGGGVIGNVNGSIGGEVDGHIYGDVKGDVGGNVHGEINGRNWEFIETPKGKLQRLITESGNQDLMEAFNQMENNS